MACLYFAISDLYVLDLYSPFIPSPMRMQKFPKLKKKRKKKRCFFHNGRFYSSPFYAESLKKKKRKEEESTAFATSNASSSKALNGDQVRSLAHEFTLRKFCRFRLVAQRKFSLFCSCRCTNRFRSRVHRRRPFCGHPPFFFFFQKALSRAVAGPH